jgi:hypothetical protein
MEEQHARQLLIRCNRASEELFLALQEIDGRVSPTEQKNLRRVLGGLVESLLSEVINPLCAEYPQITPPDLKGCSTPVVGRLLSQNWDEC